MTAYVGAAATLPHDRAMDRASRLALPYHERLALIGDADRRDVADLRARRFERLARERHRRAIDFLGVVLDPSRLGIVLTNFAIRAAADFAGRIDDEDGSACSALIDRKYEVGHRRLFCGSLRAFASRELDS